jgi:flagellar basal-body rod modification protein FlgD
MKGGAMFTDSITPTLNQMIGTTKSASRAGEADSGQFMLLLLAQLRNQNPLDPVQDKDFMGQVAQLNSLQELQKMNATLQSLTKSNRLTEAAGLIGRTIQYRAGDGQVQTGLVDGVTLQGDQAMLLLGSAQVALADVISVNAGAGGQ